MISPIGLLSLTQENEEELQDFETCISLNKKVHLFASPGLSIFTQAMSDSTVRKVCWFVNKTETERTETSLLLGYLKQ